MACNFFSSICHVVDQALMVFMLAQLYFKTAFNNRSIWGGSLFELQYSKHILRRTRTSAAI